MSKSRTPVERLDSLLAGLEDEVLTSRSGEGCPCGASGNDAVRDRGPDPGKRRPGAGTGAWAGRGGARRWSQGDGGPGDGEARKLGRGKRARR